MMIYYWYPSHKWWIKLLFDWLLKKFPFYLGRYERRVKDIKDLKVKAYEFKDSRIKRISQQRID
jgi:hypothetical protein